MLEQVFIWGASGHALFVANILKYINIEVVGLIDDVSPSRAGESYFGMKVLGGREALPLLKEQGVFKCVPGFGSCSGRLKVANFLSGLGFELTSAIHPMAVVAHTSSIGSGSVVGPGAIIDAACIVEENCILNNNTCISHGCHISAGVHLCPGVTVGGDVVIGRGSWIGIGSTIIEKVQIGCGCYIGAGAVVTKNVPDNSLAYGVPARVIRTIPYDF